MPCKPAGLSCYQRGVLTPKRDTNIIPPVGLKPCLMPCKPAGLSCHKRGVLTPKRLPPKRFEAVKIIVPAPVGLIPRVLSPSLPLAISSHRKSTRCSSRPSLRSHPHSKTRNEWGCSPRYAVITAQKAEPSGDAPRGQARGQAGGQTLEAGHSRGTGALPYTMQALHS
jgi:hypothetical protein